MASKTPGSTVSSIAKPRTMSAVSQTGPARPSSPKITKRINSSSLVQPTPTNFGQSRLATSKISPTAASQPKPLIKKPTSTLNGTKPLAINSSANRLNSLSKLSGQQSTTKLQSSRTSSTTSIKGRELPKKQLVKDTISNSAFVPREKLEKLTKKHEELTNKYNVSAQVISQHQTAVDALSCLINYMAVDLDAFECPHLKKRVQHLESSEQNLRETVSSLTAETEKLTIELELERRGAQKEKENLLDLFEVEMKSAEKNFQENLKAEETKRVKAEKDLLYLKQNLSKDKKIEFLNKEIESLKTVLELKENEMKDLRYKLDRTFVDKDEITALRNERDNLSLAKEQLEYSLNMKNEELKFVLQETSSLAPLSSLSSLTSTPLNNDRNNNVVKKRKMNSQMKKQKLDSNERDEDNFLKPLNLHNERFAKPTTSEKEYLDRPFEDEQVKSLEQNFVRPLADEENFEKVDDHQFEENNFDEPDCFSKPMSLDHNHDHLDDNLNDNLNDNLESTDLSNIQDDYQENSFRQPSEDVHREPEYIPPHSIERGRLSSSFNAKHDNGRHSAHCSLDSKQMDTSLDRPTSSSFHRASSAAHHSSSNHSFGHLSHRHSFSHKSSADRPLDESFTSRLPGEQRNSQKENSFSQKENSFVKPFDKPFDLNEIKEKAFLKPIDKRESPVKPAPEKSDENAEKFRPPEHVYLQQEHFIKTCQILNDENEISIIKSNKKLESVLDSGFCDL